MNITCQRLGMALSKSDLSKKAASNINGPCCLKVPDWCQDRLGTYYLYFSHHTGKYIRMAYADDIRGPWKEYNGEILSIDQLTDAYDHVASPDIFVDEDEKQIRMYFHSPSKTKQQQWSYVAISSNGLDFKQTIDFPLAPFYLRIVKFNDLFLGMSKGGNIWCSQTGLREFEPIINPFNVELNNEIWHNNPGSVRHVSLLKSGEFLYIFFSRIGDFPESIFYGRINTKKPMNQWHVDDIALLIKPDMEYEGSMIKLKVSEAGASDNEENALRDPYVFKDNGKLYMFYCVKGEHGIALAEVDINV